MTERPRIRVRVDTGRLVALSPFDQEIIDKLPLGAIVAEIDAEEATDGLRNFFFAGINLLYQNVDGTGPGKTWPTPDSLRKYVLKEIGFAEPVLRVDGVKWVPLSMARNEMSFESMTMCLELSRAFALDKWGFDAWADWSDAKDLERQHR